MPLIPYMGGGVPGGVTSMPTPGVLVNMISATPTPVITSTPTATTSADSSLSSEKIQALVDAMGTFPLPGVLDDVAGKLPLDWIKRSSRSNDTVEPAVKTGSPDPKPLSEEQVQALLTVADKMMRQKLFQVGLINERPPLPTDPDVMKLNDMVTAILEPDNATAPAANATTPKHQHQKRWMVNYYDKIIDWARSPRIHQEFQPWGVREPGPMPWGMMGGPEQYKAQQEAKRSAMYTDYMIAVGLEPTPGGNLPWLTIKEKETLTKTMTKSKTVSTTTTVTATPTTCLPRASKPMVMPGLNAPDGNPRNPLNLFPFQFHAPPMTTEPATSTMESITTTTTDGKAASTDDPKTDISSAKDSGLAVVVFDPHDGKEVETLRQLIDDAGNTPGAMGPAPETPENPFTGGPGPGDPYLDDLGIAAPYPDDPYADLAPYPPAPYPAPAYPPAPYPPAPYPAAPYPPAPYPGPPYPAWPGPAAPAAPPQFPPANVQRAARDVPPPESTPLPTPLPTAHSKRSVDSPVQSFLRVPDALRWKYKPKEGTFHPPGSSRLLHKLKPASLTKLASRHLHAKRDQCTSTGCMLRDGGIIYGLMGGALIAVIILALLIGGFVKIVSLVKMVMARRQMRREVEAAGTFVEGDRDVESQHLVQIPQPAALK